MTKKAKENSGDKTLNKRKKKARESSVEEELIQYSRYGVDGKWGWFVVLNSFLCNMIVDGMQYTFANFLTPISRDMAANISATSLIGSLLSGFYNFSGPIAGALGNKFGFRMVIITGSLVSGAGMMLSYFAPDLIYLYFFYGILGGLGFGMIYMASVIMTSLYFEKYRALAASLSVCGTGVGTFIFSPMGSWLVKHWGWKHALLVEGGIVLICILCGLSFKPLKIVSVIPISRPQSEGSPESSIQSIQRGSIYYSSEPKKPLANEAYPTFREALHEGAESRRATVISVATKSVKGSVISSVNHPLPIYSIVPGHTEEVKPVGRKKRMKRCCRVCCFNFWHCRCKHEDLNLGDRPMYRDDIFYGGSLSTLEAYDSGEPINYHLSVTRVPDAAELEQHAEQKCCVCHPAVLRTCITMTGVHLLRSKVFLFLCIASFFYTMSLYIPYVFVRKLARQHKIPNDQAVWLLSAIGIANTAGRLLSGIIKSFVKINAALFSFGCLVVSSVICFIFLFIIDLPAICVFSCVFGMFTAPFISLRPVIIVEFLGLEKLTNAFGLMLLGQGVACIIGPPIAGILEQDTGHDEYVIYLSGGLMFLSSGALLASVLTIEAGRSKPSKEKEEEEEEKENEGKKKKKKKKEKEKKNDDEVSEDSSSNNAFLAVEPPNGGWGWVVVLSAFYCNIIVDGIQLAFGIFLNPISKDLDAEISEVALAGSLMFGVHLLMGPVCAGCNAVFGLRPVTITGSLICSLGIGISYFSTGFWFLYFSFGILGGIGLGLVYMNTLVITSLYFTTLMPLAVAIVVCGTGVGTMVFAALGNFLLSMTTWQNSFLMQAALAGSMSLVALTFKPLKPSRVKIATVENAPDEQESSSRRRSVFIKTDFPDQGSIITIRNFQSLAVSFADTKSVSEYGDTLCFCSRCCRKKKQQATNILVLRPVEDGDPETRRKSYVEEVNRRETIEEEEIAVTLRKQSSHQVYARIDLRKQRPKNFWLTLKRTLVFMLDCRLLRSFSFFVFTMSSAINLASCLIVFIYEKDRVETLGFSRDTSVSFIITLGGATVFWRLLLGGLSLVPKIHFLALTVSGMTIGGIGAVASGYYTNIYFQYGFCILFSLGMASFAVFRIPLLIYLVGTDMVENATGINLLFMGISCIIFPPFFGWIMQITTSYNVIFAITGTLIVLSALSLVRLKKVDMEAIKKSNKTPKRGRHVLRND